jgi:hypothetical protein
MQNKKPLFYANLILPGGSKGIFAGRSIQQNEADTGMAYHEFTGLGTSTSSGTITQKLLVCPKPDKPNEALYTAQEIVRDYGNFAQIAFPTAPSKALREAFGDAVYGLRRFENVVDKIFRGGKFGQSINAAAFLVSGKLNQLFRKAKYDPRPLQSILRHKLRDARVADALTSVMIYATDLGVGERCAWINSIKGEPDTSPQAWSTMLMRDAAYAASSAPFFLPIQEVKTYPEGKPQLHTLSDGWTFTSVALANLEYEANRLAPPGSEVIIGVYGTGISRSAMTAEEHDRGGISGLLRKDKADFMSNLISVDPVHEQARIMKKRLGDKFFYFNYIIDEKKPGAPSMALDEGRPSVLRHRLEYAEECIEKDENLAGEFRRFRDLVKERGIAKRQLPGHAGDMHQNGANGVNDNSSQDRGPLIAPSLR